MATTDWGYVRFHGGRAHPPGGYGRRSLERWAERILALWPAPADVFVFFNNDMHGCALRDAVVIGSLLRASGRALSRLPAPG